MKYEWSFGAATFKRRLILLMDEKDLSQNAVAELAGISQGTVSRWLTGSTPELENVTTLATNTGVPLSWLAYGEGHLKISYKGIDGFIHRAKSKTIPRLNDACDKLTVLLDSDYFSPEEAEVIEDMRQKLSSRRARLSGCVSVLEQLAPSESALATEILAKFKPSSAEVGRMDICWFMGVPVTASDEEIIDACKKMLRNKESRATKAELTRAEKVRAAKAHILGNLAASKRGRP